MKKINNDLVINDDNKDFYFNYLKKLTSNLSGERLDSIRNTYTLLLFCFGILCLSAVNPLIVISSPILTMGCFLIISIATGIITKKVYKYITQKNQRILMGKFDEYEKKKELDEKYSIEKYEKIEIDNTLTSDINDQVTDEISSLIENNKRKLLQYKPECDDCKRK